MSKYHIGHNLKWDTLFYFKNILFIGKGDNYRAPFKLITA